MNSASFSVNLLGFISGSNSVGRETIETPFWSFFRADFPI
jgi:hypothetical protein